MILRRWYFNSPLGQGANLRRKPDDPLPRQQPREDPPKEDPPADPPKAASSPEPANEELKSLQAQVSQIGESLASMQSFFKTLEERAQAGLQDPPQGPAEPDDEEFASEFYQKPGAAVDQRIRQRFASEAQPILSAQADFAAESLVREQRAEIDQKFGPGTWDDLFEKELRPVINEVKRTNPVALLNPTALRNAVNTVVGKNWDTLAEKRTSYQHNTEQEEQQKLMKLREELARTPGFSGGFRTGSDGKPKLSDEQLGMLDEWKKHDGHERNPELLAAMDGVDSIEDYRRVKSKLNGKGAQA